jgi:hypothetical protein
MDAIERSHETEKHTAIRLDELSKAADLLQEADHLLKIQRANAILNKAVGWMSPEAEQEFDAVTFIKVDELNKAARSWIDG